MRKLTTLTFLTLDGVMQAPGGPEEDPTGGFSLGGWTTPYWDEQTERRIDEALKAPFDLLLGRKTYEIFAAHWPYDEESEVAAHLNATRKYVASTTLRDPSWNNTTALGGDLAVEVAELKEQEGPEIQVHGSWQLIQSLLDNELVDEFRLLVFPVVVGRGKRLFAEGSPPTGFTVTDSSVSATGVVMATWARSGAVTPGSFAFEEPTEAELQRRENLDS